MGKESREEVLLLSGGSRVHEGPCGGVERGCHHLLGHSCIGFEEPLPGFRQKSSDPKFTNYGVALGKPSNYSELRFPYDGRSTYLGGWLWEFSCLFLESHYWVTYSCLVLGDSAVSRSRTGAVPALGGFPLLSLLSFLPYLFIYLFASGGGEGEGETLDK